MLCALALAVMILLAGCSEFGELLRGDEIPKDDIFKIVLENRETILADISSEDFENALAIEGIKEISPAEYFGDGVYDFYCGGSGFASNTSYCGFYYVGDRDASCLYDKDGYKKTVDGNIITWRQSDPGGDNEFVLEKICDGFWYYHLKY